MKQGRYLNISNELSNLKNLMLNAISNDGRHCFIPMKKSLGQSKSCTPTLAFSGQ
jgi:hypothetical protein